MERNINPSQLSARPSGPTLEELLRDIAGGSDEAVWTLIDRYSKNIARLVRRQLPAEIQTKLDPGDIVQSIWKSLLRRGRDLSFDTSEQFLAYLAGMARLKVFETHRRYRYQATDVRREVNIRFVRDTEGDDNVRYDGGHEPSDSRCENPAAMAAARERWQNAITRLGDRGHQVVELKLKGLSPNEIAEQLSISTSTVQRTLSALLSSLSV